MRRTPTDDRVATDPHGFAPVPSYPGAEIPRQRADRPVHDPWDPAHAPDPYDDERYPDAAYVPPGRHEPRFDEPDGYDDPRYGAESTRPRRRANRRDPDGGRRRDAARPPRRSRNQAPERSRSSRDRPSAPPRSRAAAPAALPADDGLRIATVAVPVAIGSLVAIGIGVWARMQEPTGVAVNLAGFSSGGAVKTWLATLALVLALAQVWTGRVLLGRSGAAPTALTATVHRWSGRLAVLVTVPVAVQCLVALGWSGATTRTLVHSLLGCVFYGAFVAKMLLLRRPGVPGWVIAVSGGLLLAVLSGLWLTSALWFFGTHGLSF